MGWVQALTGSVVRGAGIAGLHSLGMAAVRLSAVRRSNSLLVILSLVLAVVFPVAVLLLAFDLREETKPSRGDKAIAKDRQRCLALWRLT
jgi:NO-binding membrane sensor protein with MHYT domain